MTCKQNCNQCRRCTCTDEPEGIMFHALSVVVLVILILAVIGLGAVVRWTLG